MTSNEFFGRRINNKDIECRMPIAQLIYIDTVLIFGFTVYITSIFTPSVFIGGAFHISKNTKYCFK